MARMMISLSARINQDYFEHLCTVKADGFLELIVNLTRYYTLGNCSAE